MEKLIVVIMKLLYLLAGGGSITSQVASVKPMEEKKELSTLRI